MVRTPKKTQDATAQLLWFAMGSMASAQSTVSSVALDLEDCHGSQDQIDDALSALEGAVKSLNEAKAKLQGGV